MTQLFDRTGYITIDGSEIHDLDMQFAVRRTLSPEINKASVTVFNLSQASRNKIKDRGQTLEVFAGYGKDPVRIFVGSTFHSQSTLVEHTYVTRIEAGDGTHVQRIFANEAWAPGVKVVDVIRALVRIIGVGSGNLEAQISKGVFDDSEVVTFSNGYATSGQAIEALSIVLRGYDVRWSIQDQEIVLLPLDGVLDAPLVEVRSIPADQNTGLIGTPVRTSNGGVIFRHMLKGEAFQCGREVYLESRDLVFGGRIDIVQHAGDTRGGQWESVCECADLSNLDFVDRDPFLS